MVNRKNLVLILSICLSFLTVVLFKANAVDLDADGVPLAIKGYDPVAYHTENHATKGYPNLYFKHSDVNWHFANTEHRELFIKETEKYTPAYEGYCANAMCRKGYKKMSDPEIWKIVEGRLYLFADKYKKEEWEKNIAENIQKGDENWGKLMR